MRFDGTRPRTSHGTGRWRREDFAAWGEGTTVEETALVFRPEHIRLGAGVYVGHGTVLKAYDGGDLEIGDAAHMIERESVAVARIPAEVIVLQLDILDMAQEFLVAEKFAVDAGDRRA